MWGNLENRHETKFVDQFGLTLANVALFFGNVCMYVQVIKYQCISTIEYMVYTHCTIYSAVHVVQYDIHLMH